MGINGSLHDNYMLVLLMLLMLLMLPKRIDGQANENVYLCIFRGGALWKFGGGFFKKVAAA